MTTVSGQHVSDYMHRQLEVVPQDTSVVTVATQMRTRSVGSVLIECFDRPHNDCRIAGIHCLFPGTQPQSAALPKPAGGAFVPAGREPMARVPVLAASRRATGCAILALGARQWHVEYGSTRGH